MTRSLRYGLALAIWLCWGGSGPHRSNAQGLPADPVAEKAREAVLRTADQQWQAEAYFEAGKAYQELMEIDPANLEAAYRLAECHRLTFDYKAAETWYANVDQKDHQAYPLALYYQALMLRHNRSLVDAMIRFDQFIRQATAPGAKPDLLAFAAKAGLEKTAIEIALREPKPDLTYFERFRLADLSGEYKLKADRIVRRKEAGRLHKEEMPLYGEEAFFYNEQLSQSERAKVGKITAVGLVNLNASQMDTIHQADQTYFAQLPPPDQARVNRFAVAYRRAVDNNERVILTDDDDAYYHRVSTADRARLDRVIAFRMHEAISSQMARMKNKRHRLEEIDAVEATPVASLSDERASTAVSLTDAERLAEDLRYYHSLPESERDRVDRILEARRLAKRTGAALALSGEDQFYYAKLSEQDKARLDRLADILPSPEKRSLTPAELRAEDLRYYHSLPESERDRVDRILEARRLATRTGAALALNGEDQFYYAKLSEQDKARLDRLADMLPSPGKRGLTLAEQLGEDQRHYEGLPEQEKKRFDRILEARRLATRTGAALLLSQEDQQYYNALSEMDKARLDRLAEAGGEAAALLANLPAQPSANPAENSNLPKGPNTDAPETIFFNFDQDALRKEARKALTDLADFMRQYPAARIEIHAFADDLGDEAYNRVLCWKRGKAVEQYLSRHGVDTAALTVKAWGKQRPPVNLSDSSYARQLNRRVDFRVTGVPENYVWKNKMYILQPDATLYSVARAFGLTVEELKTLNGITSERIGAYQPIRARNVGRVLPTPMVKDPRVALDK